MQIKLQIFLVSILLCEERSQAVLTEMNTSTGGLLCSTCLTLLVQATMSARPRVQVKSVPPALRKALVTNQTTKSHFCANITKKQTNFQCPKGSPHVQKQVSTSDRNNGRQNITISRHS